MYIGYKAAYKSSKYEFGPFSVEKFKQQLELNDPSYFEAILPPKQHLLDNKDKYNISAEINLAQHFVQDDLYILIRSSLDGVGTNYTILVTQGTNGASDALEDGVMT